MLRRLSQKSSRFVRYSTRSRPHEVAESEERDSHDWGKISEKDTSFEDLEQELDSRVTEGPHKNKGP